MAYAKIRPWIVVYTLNDDTGNHVNKANGSSAEIVRKLVGRTHPDMKILSVTEMKSPADLDAVVEKVKADPNHVPLDTDSFVQSANNATLAAGGAAPHQESTEELPPEPAPHA